MPAEITMPQLSDTMTEGTVVKWNKKEGDRVKAGEELAEVETDKATMPMEAFESGTLAVISVKEGEKVPVGGRLGVIATGSEKLEDVKKQYASGAAAAATSAAPKPPAKAQGAAAGSASKPTTAPQGSATVTLERAAASEIHEPDEVGHGATREPSTAVPPVSHHGNGGDGNGADKHIKASPLARRIAEERKIDLGAVRGSGPGGRIVQDDVLKFTGAAASTAPAPTGGAPARAGAPAVTKKTSTAISLAPKIASGQKQSVPLTKIRSVIAQRLQQSKQQLPHFYTTVDVDVEDVSKLREQMNKALESEGIRLSLGDLIAKAISHALLVHPAVNAHFGNNEITRFGDVNLGMAVALPDGLIVPVLRGVNKLSLRDIRTRSADLVERARGQKLRQDEMTGATFTVSNLGTYGVREFSAIINPPEVAILAVGAAEKRPVVREDQIVPRTMMTLTLSADHRAVDGATAAEFLRTLRTILEEPGIMLV